MIVKPRAVGHRLGDRLGARANGASSNTPIGPFHSTVRRLGDRRRRRSPRSRARCRDPSTRRDATGADDAARLRVSRHLLGDHDVDRHAARVPVSSSRRQSLDAVGLHERVADAVALRGEERERHRAADEDRVAPFEQRVDHAELVAHLRAAEHGDERVLRRVEQTPSSTSTSRSSSRPAADGSTRRRADDRRVRAVRRAERVVHVRRRPARAATTAKAGSFGRLTRVEPQVLEQHHLTGDEARRHRRGRNPTTSGASGTSHAEQLGEALGDRCERVLRVRHALRPAEVAARDHGRALVAQPLDRGQRGADAQVVGDRAVTDRAR